MSDTHPAEPTGKSAARPVSRSSRGSRKGRRLPASARSSSDSIPPGVSAALQRGRGTFLLVTVAAGGGVIGATAYGGDLTLAMKALAPGIMVMGIIFFMGTISGARRNPAVTLAFATRGNFPWIRVPGYIGAQLAARSRHRSSYNGCTAMP